MNTLEAPVVVNPDAFEPLPDRKEFTRGAMSQECLHGRHFQCKSPATCTCIHHPKRQRRTLLVGESR